MELTKNLRRKIKFVEDLNQIICPVQPNIESMQYRIFLHTKYDWTAEYLVINYVGGARTVRCCNGNSLSAIFMEIARYLESGKYDEEQSLVDAETLTDSWKEMK